MTLKESLKTFQTQIILNKGLKIIHGKTFNASLLYKRTTQNDRRVCQEKWHVKHKPGTRKNITQIASASLLLF